MQNELHAKALESASHQCGVLSRGQLLALGFTDSAIRSYVGHRRFSKLFSGVYSTVTGEPTQNSLLWAAHLRCGSESYIYGPTALEFWGFRSTDSDIWVAIPHSARRVQDSWLRVTRVGTARRIKIVRDLPVEAPADALVDATKYEKDSEKVQNLIVDAVQQRIVKTQDLVAVLESRRIPHRKIFDESIGFLQGGQTTRLEINANRNVIRAHGLPDGRWQANLNFNGVSQIVDLYFPEYKMIIEFDGRLGHDSSAGRFRDMARDNRAAFTGHTTLRFGSADVRYRQCDVALQMAEVLAIRGWPGSPTPCKSHFCVMR